MCFIMGAVGEVRDIIHVLDRIKIRKGSEKLDAAFSKRIFDNPISFNSIQDLINLLRQLSFNYTISLLIHSRQRPELEEKEPKYSQPIRNTEFHTYIALHGTITNDKTDFKDLYEQYNLQVDSDILRHIGFSRIKDLQGNYVLVLYDSSIRNVFRIYNTGGLGVWVGQHNTCLYFTTEREENLLQEFRTDKHITLNQDEGIFVYPNNKFDVIYLLDSGGLDSTATAVKLRELYPHTPIIGVYFKWKSKASKIEQQTVESHLQKGIIDDYILFDTNRFMNYYLQIVGTTPSLVSGKKNADAHSEAEQGLAYVPYRNTVFLVTLAAWLEQNEPRKYSIAIGANLSEAMASNYGDNSDGYLEVMEKVLQIGGKITDRNKDIKLLAPFKYYTKTNMLKSFSREQQIKILNNSISCYYPKKGKPCGKCGSCLLRSKVIEELGLSDAI